MLDFGSITQVTVYSLIFAAILSVAGIAFGIYLGNTTTKKWVLAWLIYNGLTHFCMVINNKAPQENAYIFWFPKSLRNRVIVPYFDRFLQIATRFYFPRSDLPSYMSIYEGEQFLGHLKISGDLLRSTFVHRRLSCVVGRA